MLVIMDTCTRLNENMDSSIGNLSNNSEAISMRSRLRSRNASTTNANAESTATSTATTATSTVRKVSKIKNNTPINQQNNSATTVKANANTKSSSLSTNSTLIANNNSTNSASKCNVDETSVSSSGWPLVLDYCRDECKRMLREYELCAYEQMVRVFRAQGNLTDEKRKLLHTLQQMLSISIERHQGEIRRATFDETLVTIAKRLNCQENSLVETDVISGWIEEGTRLIPLMPRLVPQTAFHTMANHVAVNQLHRNANMPLPGQTGNVSRLADRSIVTSPTKITTLTSKRSRLDSVSSTSLIVKNNNTTSTSKASSTTTISQPKTSAAVAASSSFSSSSSSSSSPASLDSPASTTTTTTTFKGKCNNKLPLNKVPSVAKATVTSNSGITTTHLAVVRKSVGNILRQSSPCKSMLNCEASIGSLATNKSYISPSKSSSNYELSGSHSNVSRVIFVPSSTSSTTASSSSSSYSSPPNRGLVKSSSQVSKLIATSLEDALLTSDRVNYSSSSSNSNVKILHSSTNCNSSSPNFPLKKGHSVTVIPSSTYQRLNLVANKQQQVYNTSSKMSSVISATSSTTANGVSSTNSSGVNLPGQGVIIQTYGRTTSSQANGGKKTNLIIVPSSSSKSITGSMSVKGSITMSTASSAATSSIIGKVVVPSTIGTSVLLPSGTSVKRSLVTTATEIDSPNKKARILAPNKDSPKVITLQPAKTSSNSMSGRMIGVPGLTAQAVESLIKGHVTPEIMKLVQSAVSASLAKDQEAKQQVTTNASSSSSSSSSFSSPSSKSITSLTNSLPSSITVSKVSSSPKKVFSPTKESTKTSTATGTSIKSVACLNSNVVKDEKISSATDAPGKVPSTSTSTTTTSSAIVSNASATVESSSSPPPPVDTAGPPADTLIASEKEESTSKDAKEAEKSPLTEKPGETGQGEITASSSATSKVEEQVNSGQELTSDKVKPESELKNSPHPPHATTSSTTTATAKSPQNSLDAVNLTNASVPMKEATVNCIKTENEEKPAELNVTVQANDEQQVIDEPEFNCKIDEQPPLEQLEIQQQQQQPENPSVHLNDDSIHPTNLLEADEKDTNKFIGTLSDESTNVKTTASTECPRIQPIKLSRQGSSWVPFSLKSDESNDESDPSDPEEEEADEDDTPEDEDEEEEMDTGMSQTKESIDEHSVETNAPLSDLEDEDEDDTTTTTTTNTTTATIGNNNEINCQESHRPLVSGYGSDSNDLSQPS